jgi:hypothetical protein
MEKESTQGNNTNQYIKRVKGKKKRKKRDITHLLFSNISPSNENKEKTQMNPTIVPKKEVVNQWDSDQVGTVNLKLVSHNHRLDPEPKQGWSDEEDSKPLIFSCKTEQTREQENLKQIIAEINEEEKKLANSECDQVSQ